MNQASLTSSKNERHSLSKKGPAMQYAQAFRQTFSGLSLQAQLLRIFRQVHLIFSWEVH